MALVEATGSTGLREKKKAATQVTLKEAALRLFAERGFADVSVDEIALAAGVSRSTFFRYFGSKEAVLFDELDEAGDTFLMELNARPASESPWTAYEQALIATIEARSTEAINERSLILDRLLREDPALVGRRMAVMQRWSEILADIFARRAGREAPSMEDRLAATTCLATNEEVNRIWKAEGKDSTVGAAKEAFRVLRSLTR